MKNNLVKASGFLGIVFGTASLIIISLYPSKTLLNSALAGIALVFLLIFFIFHYEAFKAFSRKRSTHLGINSILMIVFFIFIAVIFNLIARQYYFRIDLSSTSGYSLAPQTKSIAGRLKSEVRVIVFTQENSPSFKKAKELLEGYRYLNRNFIYSVVDLDRSPLLAKEYGITQYDSIAVKGDGSPVIAYGIDEETMTNAVIKATRKARKKIYFMAGHGERDINNSGRDGMSRAALKLNSIGYITSTIVLSAVNDIPKDTDLLIMAGPVEKPDSGDMIKIDSFISGGGRLIVMLDPGYDSSWMADRAGISLNDGMVVDYSSNLDGKNEKIPLISTYPDTPVTKRFKLSTVYPEAASLLIRKQEGVYEYFPIVTASPQSRLLKGGKIIGEEGNYVIAAVAGSRKGRDILMVYGDSDFASNAFFDVLGNANLFLNSINWIAEEGELVSITPGKDDFIPLYITPEQGKAIMYISVIAIPFSVFAAGIFIWWRRTRL